MTTTTKNFLRHILPSHATACQDKARKSQGSFIKYIKYNDFTHATTSQHFKQWISKAADFDTEKSEELIINNNHVGFVCNNMMLNLYPNSSHGWLYFSQPTWQFDAICRVSPHVWTNIWPMPCFRRPCRGVVATAVGLSQLLPAEHQLQHNSEPRRTFAGTLGLFC